MLDAESYTVTAASLEGYRVLQRLGDVLPGYILSPESLKHRFGNEDS